MLNGSSSNSTPPPPQSSPGPSTYYQNPYHYPQDPHHTQFPPYPNGHHPQPTPHHRPSRGKSRRGGSYNSRSNYQQYPPNHYQQTHHYYPNATPYNYHTYPHQWPTYYPPIPSQALTPTSPGTPIHAYQDLHHIHPMHLPEEHAQHFLPHTEQPSETSADGPHPVSDHESPAEPSQPPKATTDMMELGSDPASIHALQASLGGWAIWSRRPRDPSTAPGVIISPRTKPPSHILEQALDIPTPPPTPPPPPPRAITQDIIQPGPSEEAAPTENLDSPRPPENISIPSSSATDTTPHTTRPASPASSSTSVSVGNASVKAPAAPIDSHPPPAASVSDSQKPSSPAAPAESLPSTTSQPATSPPSFPAPPPKKSWASLLRPAPGTAQVHSQLPVSSVVGFSIPAEALSTPSTDMTLNDSKKAALFALLTGRQPGPTQPVSGYASAIASAPPRPVAPTPLDMQKIRPRGLVNSGNMCFANAVLQILVYCQPFHSFFAELGKLLPPVKSTSEEDDASAAPLVRATINFLQEFIVKAPALGRQESSKGKERARNGNEESFMDGYESDWDAFMPTNFYDAMKEKKRFDSMTGGQQEDAEEFFGFFLDSLEEELLALSSSLSPNTSQPPTAVTSAPKEVKEAPDDGWMEVGKRNKMVITRTIKNTESVISRIFGGKSRSTLKAVGLKDSAMVEEWRSLRLDIQRDQVLCVEDALAHISDPQTVQIAHPTRSDSILDANQQVLLESLPSVLVLHVKRFCYDTTVGGVVKVAKHIRYGPELQIGIDLLSLNARPRQATKYKLFGVIYHHGISAGGGHYTLDVLHPCRYGAGKEGWVRVDDELVSDVGMQDVFDSDDRDNSRCAYLLFYRRIGAAVR